jgi:hypothetical protein
MQIERWVLFRRFGLVRIPNTLGRNGRIRLGMDLKKPWKEKTNGNCVGGQHRNKHNWWRCALAVGSTLSSTDIDYASH